MGATHEQVNLMLHLYELRRETKLREARIWMSVNFHPKTADEAMKLVPPGTKENAYMRMVLGYWEMVASIANRGLVDEELFFENAGEQWGVWEQVKPLVGSLESDVCKSAVPREFGRALQAAGCVAREAQSRVH